MKTSRALFASVALVLFVRTAHADGPGDVAAQKRFIAVAQKLKAGGALDLAAEQYEAAYKAAPAAGPLRDELACYKELGQNARMLEVAKRLLDRHAKELRRTETAELKKLVAGTESKVGQIELKVSESGAAVTIDERAVGESPFAAPLLIDVGAHKIAVTKAGFERFESSVNVEPQRASNVEVALEKEIVSAKVSVKEKTGQSVAVVVDGSEVGPAPWSGALPLGAHEIALASKSMRAAPRKVELKKRDVVDLELEASPIVGRLEVATNDGMAVVRVDGVVVGQGRVTAENVPPGEHVVGVERKGFQPFRQKIAVEPGKTLLLNVALAADEAASAPKKDDPGEMSGAYGALQFLGTVQAGEMGNQAEVRCAQSGVSCSSSLPKGGGLLAVIGHAFGRLGGEIAFGGMGDGAVARISRDDGTSTAYEVYRAGGIAALRIRGALQNKAMRVSLSAGPGVGVRYGGVSGASWDGYVSPAGTADLTFALRLGTSTAFSMGCMFWAENAGSGKSVVRDNTPFLVMSGPQFLVHPHLGLAFGP